MKNRIHCIQAAKVPSAKLVVDIKNDHSDLIAKCVASKKAIRACAGQDAEVEVNTDKKVRQRLTKEEVNITLDFPNRNSDLLERRKDSN